jgi:type III pantothenate kinase
MLRLTIDQGNSFTKVTFFADGKLLDHSVLSDQDWPSGIVELIKSNSPTSAIFSSVRTNPQREFELVSSLTPCIRLNHEMRFPFSISYETPLSLGPDRLANAAGAVKRHQNGNILIVDCGTCTTFTLIENKNLIGGAISPGILMRLKSLHHFTGKLPLVELPNYLPEIIGTSSEKSILAGAVTGAFLETDGIIQQYCSQFNDLIVLLTGGMMSFFEAHLKSPIFAAPILTPEGLHEILSLNEY